MSEHISWFHVSTSPVREHRAESDGGNRHPILPSLRTLGIIIFSLYSGFACGIRTPALRLRRQPKCRIEYTRMIHNTPRRVARSASASGTH